MTTGEKRLLVVLVSTALASLTANALLLARARTEPRAVNTQAALADPELRAEIIGQLSRNSAGVWDTHNDPEVGRVLQPNLREAIATGVLTQTNALGLRERDFELPKPAGMLRVVLLGDSFIQGFGVEAQDRVGVWLEQYLKEHATGWTGPLECLHIAVGGWNVVAECAYLRRLLSEVAPDLVIQVLISNDLDDHMGARGFGGLAAFAPLWPRHTDALVSSTFPRMFTSQINSNFLLMGADFESRHRFGEAAAAIGRLASLVRQSGARYVAVSYGLGDNERLWHFLQEFLRPEEFACLPARLSRDPDMVLSETDGHWSRKGHELVARLFFALIRRRELLPQLALTPWAEPEDNDFAEINVSWHKEWRERRRDLWEPPRNTLSSLVPAHFEGLEWQQVYTGLDEQGRVSPFASFLLALRGQRTLRICGRALPRPELGGARLRASVEGTAVGEHELVPGEPFDVRFALPVGLEAQFAVNVRLETSDYCYAGPDRQHCVSFVLEQLALE